VGLPTVDVAVPCYRYGAMLPTAVRSVLDQEGVEVRVRIIDDASDDGSADVARELAAQDPRVSVVVHEQNQGHIKTFTEGVIDFPTAKYTVLMSADDALTRGSLQRATALMESHPNVVLVYGDAIDWFGEEPLPPARLAGRPVIHSGQDWLRASFARGANVVPSPTAVTRTSVQKVVGGYDPALLHTSDLEMWLRMATHGDVGYIAGADQAYCRGHEQNMSVRYEETDGGVRDLQMRRDAFLSALRKGEGRIAEPEKLERTVRRKLASEALLRVARAYDKGRHDPAAEELLIGFARETVDDLRTLPQWYPLRLRQRLGPARAAKAGVLATPPAAVRKLRQIALDKRTALRGI
jgi:Glycosyltransferases involved in cell wall biogenesis